MILTSFHWHRGHCGDNTADWACDFHRPSIKSINNLEIIHPTIHLYYALIYSMRSAASGQIVRTWSEHWVGTWNKKKLWFSSKMQSGIIVINYGGIHLMVISRCDPLESVDSVPCRRRHRYRMRNELFFLFFYLFVYDMDFKCFADPSIECLVCQMSNETIAESQTNKWKRKANT